MNYQKIYDQIIERARDQYRKKLKSADVNYVYYERHHIIPSCMGGTNQEDNLVLLTAKEHFLVHYILCEIYPKNSKLAYALWGMCNQRGKGQQLRYTPSSKLYAECKEKARKKLSERIVSKETRKKIGDYSKTRKHSELTRKKISEKLSGSNNPFFGKKHSIETKTKLSKAATGKIVSDVTRKKISIGNIGKTRSILAKERYRLANIGVRNNMYGKYGKYNPNFGSIRSEEQKNNIRIALSKLPNIKCPYCSVESHQPGNMKRWHFDNCKNRKAIL